MANEPIVLDMKSYVEARMEVWLHAWFKGIERLEMEYGPDAELEFFHSGWQNDVAVKASYLEAKQELESRRAAGTWPKLTSARRLRLTLDRVPLPLGIRLRHPGA